MANKTNKASRNWCWTLNNPTEEDIKRIDDYHSSHVSTYIIYGREIGEEEETPHLQGYTHFPSAQRFTAVKKVLPRARLAQCRGSPESNFIYCSKDKDFVEYGTRPVSQQTANKKKAARFIELAEKGDFDTIKEEQPGRYLNSYRTMKQMAVDHMSKPKDLEETCGIWIWGPTGTGKTTKARTEYGTYYSKGTNKWWDGFQDEDSAIVEDMDPSHKYMGYHLKLWLDKWSFTAEVKGGTRCLRPKRVIITSQYPIEAIWPDDPSTVEAIRRRCKVIYMAPEYPALTPPEEQERLERLNPH